MRDAAPQTIYLKDYIETPYAVSHVGLDFTLHPTATRVQSRIVFSRRRADDLVLNGENLALKRLTIDGAAVAHSVTDTHLIIPADQLSDNFTLEAEVEISPSTNTALEGLYMSGGMYCTQCEAEGFRKITYMYDRPDVMAPYDVVIHADTPVQLSNGNPGAPGAWSDPHPKPTYLFALVAGDLVATNDRFTTMEGRDVTLNIYVRPGDEAKTDYAMDALKRSMLWDEEVYSRAYDLDVFNIVAVDDFNMGAMENKGLNIFNSKYVLASPETATDTDYAFIEGIVAHEYFHNWTGNRITCRDWFQLCLKEGLTVFRDQQFSADARSAPVQRIKDVLQLRSRQFREDGGPLAHPVRPEEFVEINNFYTATVYEKGAEVIGMLRTLVGAEAYDTALTLYFDRHDGQACTIEDWLTVFEDATGRDLTQFKRWYAQAGTPRLSVTDDFKDGIYKLVFQQETKQTPGQSKKAPQVIPIALGLLGRDGAEVLPTQVVEMTEAELTLTFTLDAKPIPSLLRGLSAPVILETEQTEEDRLILLAHDTDPFNRWEAGTTLARHALMAQITSGAAPAQAWLGALAAVLRDDTLDPAFRALVLALPSEDTLANACHAAGIVPDPTAIHAACQTVHRALAQHLAADLPGLIEATRTPGPYSPAARDAAKRSLRAQLLRLQTRLDGGVIARAAYDTATNMTDQLAAFGCLLAAGDAQVAGEFEAQWRSDRLVMDKWFAMSVSEAAPAEAVATATALTAHADFDWKNPNRFRSVIAGLTAMNPAGFHDPSGAGYRFLADWLLRLDALNPQTTARMSTAFETWRRYDADRQALVAEQLDRIAAHPGLSRDTSEMIARMRDG
jgi:aminopeptidase N